MLSLFQGLFLQLFRLIWEVEWILKQVQDDGYEDSTRSQMPPKPAGQFRLGQVPGGEGPGRWRWPLSAEPRGFARNRASTSLGQDNPGRIADLGDLERDVHTEVMTDGMRDCKRREMSILP